MKNLITGCLLLFLVGCEGSPDPSQTPNDYKILCIDNVSYIMYEGAYGAYRGYGYLSIKLDEESKIIPCTRGLYGHKN